MSAISSSTGPELPTQADADAWPVGVSVTNPADTGVARPDEADKPLLCHPRPGVPMMRRSLFRR
jgi:hypothetical protein